jgi:hypothetical protein
MRRLGAQHAVVFCVLRQSDLRCGNSTVALKALSWLGEPSPQSPASAAQCRPALILKVLCSVTIYQHAASQKPLTSTLDA